VTWHIDATQVDIVSWGQHVCTQSNI